MQEATVQSQEFPLLSRTFPVHILHSCGFFSAAQSFLIPDASVSCKTCYGYFHLIFLPLGIRW